MVPTQMTKRATNKPFSKFNMPFYAGNDTTHVKRINIDENICTLLLKDYIEETFSQLSTQPDRCEKP